MKRHDDAPGWRQRNDRSAVMFGDLRVVDRLAASIASLRRVGFDGSVMNCHDDVPAGAQEVKMILKEPHARAA